MEAQRIGVAPRTSEDDIARRVKATHWIPQYPSTV